jgi:SAM-dependent methyltransferase
MKIELNFCPSDKECVDYLADNLAFPEALWRYKELKLLVSVLEEIPMEGPLLDIGCGNGVIGKMLFKSIDLGFDLAMPVLCKAKEKMVYKNLVIADARNLPFKTGVFRSIIANCVLEHIDGVERVIAECSGILQRGGKLIFTVPSEYFNKFLFLSNSRYVKLRNKKLQHISMFDAMQWESFCKKYNFTVLERRYYIDLSHLKVWDFLDFFFHVPFLGVFWHGLWDRLLKFLAVPFFVSTIDRKILDKGAGLLIVAEKN